jgi:N-acetyl-anhydromuramyl-L-alanine amidase AmpD
MELDLNKIVQHNFSDKEYVKEVHAKNQVVLHHTVSGQHINGDVNWWLSDKQRIATCILIEHDGTIHQVFSSKFWAFHLGENGKDHVKMGLPYKRNDKNSIGIEIDSWGGLVKHTDNKWYPAKWDKTAKKFLPNTKVKALENVQEYPKKFRGFYAFEKYTDAQIESVRQLLVFWNKTYGIPLEYNEDMWDLSYNALAGKSGIYSHTSYRSDKSDCHPQPELIEMLKSLK